MIDISKKDKVKVLVALYNATGPQGLGIFIASNQDMTEVEAKVLLEETMSFDYIKGRVMKVNLSGDFLDPFLYDRDNGRGAAYQAIKGISD